MSFERLYDISQDLVADAKQYHYIRTDLFNRLEPPAKNVLILKGARGIGKSTVIQQFLLNKKEEGAKVFYLSADSTLLTLSLAELAYEYSKRSGKYLAIDEIHKYENAQADIKTILDAFPNLKLIVSGSSSLNLDYAAADLSRRHVMIHAKGLSYAEYLEMRYGIDFERFTLPDILSKTSEVTHALLKTFHANNIDPLEAFKNYLKCGYYLTRDNFETDEIYYNSLINTMNAVIDSDVASVHSELDSLGRRRIKLLLKHIAEKCPFTPNISELSRNLGIQNDNTLKKYLFYLHEAEILVNLYAANKSHKDFQKPQKIFLDNTNFAYTFSKSPNLGNLRETFVANTLRSFGSLTAPTHGDFCLDEMYIFEIGGRSKTKRQIKSIAQGYVFADDIISFEKGIIPLWVLGFARNH